LEKEALALVFGVKKFHKYLNRQKFTLVADHKLLTVILGSKKTLPTLAAVRLQYWALFILGYRCKLEFRPSGKHFNADVLSGLPRCAQVGEEREGRSGREVDSDLPTI